LIEVAKETAMKPVVSGSIKCAGKAVFLRAGKYLLGAAILLASSNTLFADNNGRFEIIQADYRVEEDMWIADVRADLELSDEALEALANSVALTIQYQFRITSNRWYWTDKQILARSVNIQLSYLGLSQRYLVHHLDTGEQTSYATLYSALRQIGQLSNFPLVATERLDADGKEVVSLRVALSRDDLPGPLQMLAFWRGDFSLESKWNRWIPK
jgi:hypothetical protein